MAPQNKTNKSNKLKIDYFISWSLAVLLLLHSIAVIFLASVPPISRDELNHHLAIPKMYLQHGGIYEIPSMHFSYFPMNLDLLYLLPLYFNFDIAAKYIHFIFALLTAVILYRYLKNITSRTYGLIGALLFLTTPIIVKLSVTAYVDLGLIFFSWVCLYAFFQWQNSAFKTRHLVIAGIACGLALGTKYNGLILLLLMAAMIPLTYSQTTNRNCQPNDHFRKNINSLKGLQWSVVFILIALLLFSPWMIRNIVWKHNPVYPLYENIFNPPAQNKGDKTLQKIQQPRNAFWQRKYIYNETFAQTLLIPIRSFFQGKDDNPKLFDGKLNPCLLLLAPLAFIRRKETYSIEINSNRKQLTIFSTLFILFVFFESDFRIRYMSPAITPIVALAVIGIYNTLTLLKTKPICIQKIGQGILFFVIMYAFSYNALYIYEQFCFINPLEYLSKNINKDDYISRYVAEHPVVMYANEVIPLNAKVLCLSIGDRTYYLNRSAHLAENFYEPTNDIFNETDIFTKMMRFETTHIILNRNVYLDWATQLQTNEWNKFEDTLYKHTKLLYEKDGVQLLEITNNG